MRWIAWGKINVSVSGRSGTQLVKEVHPSAGPFSQWTQCDCLTSGPERWWCPGTWMTLMMVSGGRAGGFLLKSTIISTVLYFQTCNRTHSDHLPVVDSPQGWGMVSCICLSLSDLSTLKQNQWKIIGSSAYLNNSFLLPPFFKHLPWPDRAVWVLQ